jgi:hypothetical protein
MQKAKFKMQNANANGARLNESFGFRILHFAF